MTTKNFISALVLLLTLGGLLSCSNDDNAAAAAPKPFTITPTAMSFTAAGGNNIINISLDSSWNWTITNTASWLTVAQATGTGNAHIGLVCAANTATEPRSTTITITANGTTIQLPVDQAAYTDPNAITYEVAPDNTSMSSLTAVELAAQMGTGWNLGNSLEAIGGETAWGNPATTRAFVDKVKAAGFNTIRIPVSWSVFSDAANFTITETWMNRVEEVVNYALANNMYVIMNEHWDGGWLQPTNAQKDYANNRLKVMWTQIARRFRNYDYHLIFAGTNEVMVTNNYNAPTAEYSSVQNGFNQVFVNAVRSTGGRNAYRYLAVQSFNTNIDHAANFFTLPTDVTEKRLLLEVHYYDPYNFALNENSNITQWGSIATDPAATETWANESYVDAQFQKMKTKFIDNGVGVILGEFGAITRDDVSGSENFRKYYLHYVSNSARTHGLVPVYWDNGFIGNHTMALFNRNTGDVLYPDILTAILP